MTTKQRSIIQEAIALFKSGKIGESEFFHRVACSYCGDFQKELCK